MKPQTPPLDLTLVITPREHYGFARESLESISKHTPASVPIVYVDAGSPPAVRDYLQAEAGRGRLSLIRLECFTSGNIARNLGLARVTTKYVVFADCDVVVSPGWLEHLVACAEDTNAWLVGPVCCIGNPDDQIIHHAGGVCHIETQASGQRLFVEQHEHVHRSIRDVRTGLTRRRTEMVELHTMLARTDIFEKIGGFDEGYWATRDIVDINLVVTAAGGTIYLEPRSLVTQLYPPPVKWEHLRYYLLRWSGAWCNVSLRHFKKKWDLEDDGYGAQLGATWLTPRRQRPLKEYFRWVERLLGHRAAQAVVHLVDRWYTPYLVRQWRNAARGAGIPSHRLPTENDRDNDAAKQPDSVAA